MSSAARLFFATLYLALLAGALSAQHCPQSRRTIYFLVENGTFAKDLRYELFPILPIGIADQSERSKGWAQAMARTTPEQASDLLHGGRARSVYHEDAENMIRNYDPSRFKPASTIVKNPMKSSVEGGKLMLNATEYSRNLFLMKVTSSNYEPVYYLADFLGGCHGVDTITIMKDRPWPLG